MPTSCKGWGGKRFLGCTEDPYENVCIWTNLVTAGWWVFQITRCIFLSQCPWEIGMCCHSCSGNGDWITGRPCNLLSKGANSRRGTWVTCLVLSLLNLISSLFYMLRWRQCCGARFVLDAHWPAVRPRAMQLPSQCAATACWWGSAGTAGWLPACEGHSSSPRLPINPSYAHVPACLLHPMQGCSENICSVFGTVSFYGSSLLLG